MAHSDKIQQDSSLIMMEEQVFNIMKDLRERVADLFDRYLVSGKKVVPKLPSYELLIKQYSLHYATSVELTERVDEILELKMRVSMVRKELSDISNIKVTERASYGFISGFKKTMEKYIEELDGYKFDLVDILRNTNAKLKILESLSYYREE